MDEIRDIRNRLFSLQDKKYRDFNSVLIPTVDKNSVIGVRTPTLRKIAKELAGSREAVIFLADLPHQYFEENQLHAFLIESIESFDQCISALKQFLPYIDNWATCDQMSPKALKKDMQRLNLWIEQCLDSPYPYAVRYSILLRMRYFLQEGFHPLQAEKIATLQRKEYYIQMGIAWYFATALAKQPNAILPYFTNRKLPDTIHKTAIRKALESHRISQETKNLLRTL